ncbi:CCCH zinc finger protein [Verticillium alfalfae VaMs.102]|uniref:CCCH zinc finger protein n=1 Tax=Verticillium alfalfae (strain VaMs.102 / ATCC MYA-4576 / FGSC 10136) TaxID=526221 RepID=C9SHJ8_VERA1|nr:CCCH zinc finger protein [Verticillium alfalfae VaMs.102]EEY18421.1 CCCH zinc finger protein [Verticillium alfalfae VaMs.102]
MSSEEQELLAKISRLAGKINRHKSQQSGAQSPTAQQSAHNSHNTYRSSSHHYHPYRGGRHGPAHRNRTLNSGSHTPMTEAQPASNAVISNASGSWVATTNRHNMQLINSNVFEEKNQKRTEAIEATRKQHLASQNAREASQLTSHLHQRQGPRVAAGFARANPQPNLANAGQDHVVDIQGISFRVTCNGSKLVKLAGTSSRTSPPPRTYLLTSTRRPPLGQRHTQGCRCRRRSVPSQQEWQPVSAGRDQTPSVNVPCRMFSSTGSCPKGPTCRYIHDASKVAVCRDFLQKGKCANGEDCDLSHDLCPQRTPTCLHFIKGNCANHECPYAHNNVSPGALVCRPFGLYGFCEAGQECTERHVSECPDFSNTGVCKTKGCKLLHRERASVLRKAGEQQEDADMSSDDDVADSDDVDSDEVDEFLGGDGEVDDAEVKAQSDFISF